MKKNNLWQSKQSRMRLWVWGAVVLALFAVVLWMWCNKEYASYNDGVWSMDMRPLLGGDAQPGTSAEAGKKPSVAVQQPSSGNVVSVVAGLAGAGTFQELFTSTGIASQLTGKGPYTVFVPTDQGLSYAPSGSIRNLDAAGKKRFVQYHVVSGRMLDIDAVNSGMIPSLSKDMLNFQVRPDSGLVQINSSYALKAYRASNGIVYTINQPLFPPKR